MTHDRPGLGPLRELVSGRRALVLSGAGISTDSGIPDYRGPTGRRRPATPMLHSEFVGSPEARRRYWARSYLGWEAVRRARPNPAHHALAALEAAGVVTGIITQNVDGLHQQAGSRRVTELHGALRRVLCLGCGRLCSREAIQERLARLNPRLGPYGSSLAPDGDAHLLDTASFRVAGCLRCGGVLKPDVVFFGDNVPRERVGSCLEMLASSKLLLVVGTSLAVMSGLRFVLAAVRAAVPVAIINLGPTRGDDHAALRVDGLVGEVLPALAGSLGRLGGAVEEPPHDLGDRGEAPHAPIEGGQVSLVAGGERHQMGIGYPPVGGHSGGVQVRARGQGGVVDPEVMAGKGDDAAEEVDRLGR